MECVLRTRHQTRDRRMGMKTLCSQAFSGWVDLGRFWTPRSQTCPEKRSPRGAQERANTSSGAGQNTGPESFNFRCRDASAVFL